MLGFRHAHADLASGQVQQAHLSEEYDMAMINNGGPAH